MVTGWLARMVAALAILGVASFDGMSVLATHFSAQDDANSTAQAAADAYHLQGTVNAAVSAAEQALPKGDSLVAKSMSIDANGAVSLTVRKTAKSLVLHMFSQTKTWAVVTESGTANPPS
jgi:hypothetical protein